MSIWGIDISNHQPTADLAKAKAAGCSFVFVKGTEGGTYRDPYFVGFHAQAKALGMPLGVYHFARPGNGRTGAQEARFFLDTVGASLGELPPVLDLEDTKLSPSATVAWALDFLRTVQQATGVRPMLYTYSAFAQAHLGDGKGLEAFPLWLANYRSSTTPAPPAPTPWSSWHVWQHTSSAKVPGIPGNCDRNVTDLTVDQLCALRGGGTDAGSSIPAVFTKPPVIPKVIQKVTRAALAVDGVMGAATIRQWQKVMGTYQDGVISNPSTLIRAVQKRCGVPVDGIPGPQTWRGIQRRLGVTADGVPGPVTIKALQKRLNANQF